MAPRITALLLLFALALCLVAAHATNSSDKIFTTFSLKRKGVNKPSTRDLRRRGLTENLPTEEVMIYGDFRELAYYYAQVYVGTPPQLTTVITDTGSTLLGFPCVGCTQCGNTHLDPKFDPSRSSTCREVSCADCRDTCSGGKCTYSVSYAEGSSIRGVYYQDMVWIGDANHNQIADGDRYGMQFKFGCHTVETNLFASQLADGIMGLSQSGDSLISSLMNSGKLHSHMFSLCLQFDGGAFVLGGVDERLRTPDSPPTQWTPLTSSRAFYTVVVTGAQLDSYDLVAGAYNSGGQGTIVDSGTTFTYFPTAVFNDLKAKINTWCHAGANRCVGSAVTVRDESLCYTLADEVDIRTFPTLNILLQGGVSLDITPDRLFVNMVWDNNGHAHCLAIYPNGAAGGVIGANAMMGHDVIFDMQNRRIGFAKSTCIVPPYILYDSPTPTSSPAPPPPSSTPSASVSAPAASSPPIEPSPSVEASPSSEPAEASPSFVPSTAEAASPSQEPSPSSQSEAGSGESASSVASQSQAPPASPSASRSQLLTPSSSASQPASSTPTTVVTGADDAAKDKVAGVPVSDVVKGVAGGVISFLFVTTLVGMVMYCRSRRSQGFVAVEDAERATDRQSSRPSYRDDEPASQSDVEGGVARRASVRNASATVNP